MYKLVKYAISLIVLFGYTACNQSVSYRIEGKLTDLEDPVVYAVFESERGNVVDTVTCKPNGKFLIEQKDGDFNTMTLFFENKMLWRCVYLESGKKVKISGNAKYPSLLQIKGGDKINEKISDIHNASASLWKEKTDLSREIKVKQTSPIAEADLVARLTNVDHQLEETAIPYIKNNPDDATSLALIQYFFTNPDDSRVVDEYLALISPTLRSHFLYKSLEEYCARTKRTNIGAEAPTFKVKNINGNIIDLSKVNDKFVLLAFTESWKAQNSNKEEVYLSQAAKKYEKEDIDIVVMSLEEKGKELLKAVSNDTVRWNIVTDSAGQVSALLDLYNVSELPRYYLIDKDKKILLKTENNKEIRDILDSLFAKQPV